MLRQSCLGFYVQSTSGCSLLKQQCCLPLKNTIHQPLHMAKLLITIFESCKQTLRSYSQDVKVMIKFCHVSCSIASPLVTTIPLLNYYHFNFRLHSAWSGPLVSLRELNEIFKEDHFEWQERKLFISHCLSGQKSGHIEAKYFEKIQC